MEKEIEIVLFLLAPRAGEWNHRFIVPEGVSWNDAFLGSCSELLRLNPACGSTFSCVVPQIGGRNGNEILTVYSPSWNQLPEARQTEIRTRLKQWFDSQRDRLILTEIDWQNQKDVQVVPRPELTALYQEIKAIFKETEPTEQTKQTEPNKKILTQKSVPVSCRKRKTLRKVAIMACLLAGLLWVCSIDLREWTSEISNFFGIHPTRQEDETWKEYEPFFRWSEEKPFNRENLKAAFDDVWRLAGLNSEDTLQRYLRRPEIQALRNSQRHSTPFLILGTIPEEEKEWKEILEEPDVDPVTFHRAIGALEELQKNKEKFKKGHRIPTSIPEEPIEFPEELDAMNPEPSFFIFIENPRMSYSDLKYASLLKTFYSGTNLTPAGPNLKKFSELIKNAQNGSESFEDETPEPELREMLQTVFQRKDRTAASESKEP